MRKSLTAVICREEGGFFSLCPEIDVASQGDTIEEAKNNLKEAVELFFECASKEEVDTSKRSPGPKNGRAPRIFDDRPSKQIRSSIPTVAP